MKVLITGGAGYIGTALTQRLLARGDKVVCYDTLNFGVNPLLPFFSNRNYEMVKGDIRDMKPLKDALKGVDAIVHLAAIVGFPACDKDRTLAREVNVDGTAMLDLLRGDRPTVFASTGSVYGKLETPCDESILPIPLTTYGKTKLAAEQILKNSGNVVIYRFATAFGLSPRLRLDLLPNQFTYDAVHNRYLLVYESHFRRTFIHVQDIARAFIHALNRFDEMKGEVYNCGANHLNATKKHLVELLARQVNFHVHYADDAGHDADQRDYEVNYNRLNQTGFHVETSLEDGLAEMVRAFPYLRLPNPYSNVGA